MTPFLPWHLLDVVGYPAAEDQVLGEPQNGGIGNVKRHQQEVLIQVSCLAYQDLGLQRLLLEALDPLSYKKVYWQ
jgi:hypothetical protein